VLGTTYQLDKFIKHTQPKWIVVLDAVDDATKEAQGEQDIVRAEVSKEHGNSVFVEELAAPATPPPHRGWAVGGPRKSFAGSGGEAGPGHDRGLNLA